MHSHTGADMVSQAHALTLSKTTALLGPKAMAGVASQVLALIETGGLAIHDDRGCADGEDISPTADNKWNLMSRTYKVNLLLELGVPSPSHLKKLRGKLTNSVCFALHAKSDSAIYSKRIPINTKVAMQRANGLHGGSRLASLKVISNKVDWNQMGYFSLVHGSGNTAKQIVGLKHVSGQGIDLPEQLLSRDWQLTNNGGRDKASITFGYEQIKCAKIFEAAGKKLPKLQHMEQVLYAQFPY